MHEYTSFLADSKFYADDHFPYGLTRSGEFNRAQGELLTNHGRAYLAIAEGSRAPVTEEEERFLAVCRGECQAESAHEKVWQLFLAKTNSPRPAVSALGSVSPSRTVDFSAPVAETDI